MLSLFSFLSYLQRNNINYMEVYIMKKGKIIVIDGMDGTGKHTQSKLNN